MGDCILRRCELSDIIPVMEINLKTLPEHYSDYFYESLLEELPDRKSTRLNSSHT